MIDAMPRPRKPYLHRDVDRHGNVRWYFRRSLKHPKIRIRATFGTPEFDAAYEAAASGQPVEAIRATGKASLRWLADTWRKSSDWAVTSEATQKQRDNILARILADNGDLPFLSITDDDIAAGRERRMATPFAANNYLKTMRALFRWAKEAKHVKIDPAATVKFITAKTEGHEPWTEADLDSYRARWLVGTRQRVAMELLYWTGLRRGDAVRLGRPHVGKDGVARIKAQKTGERVSVALPAPLTAILDAGPVGDLTFITGSNGKPVTKETFGNQFRAWCEAAGVKASAHGLRKTAATEAAEAGVADQQMDAMFGWQTPEMSRLYTRAARQDVLAKEAQAKRVQNVLFPHRPDGGEAVKKRHKKSGA